MKKYAQVAILLLLLVILGVEVYTTVVKKEWYITPGEEEAAHQSVINAVRQWSEENPQQSREIEERTEARSKAITQEETIDKRLAQARAQEAVRQRQVIAKEPSRIAAEQREKALEKQLNRGATAENISYVKRLATQPFPEVSIALQQNKVKPDALPTLLGQIVDKYPTTTVYTSNGIPLASVLSPTVISVFSSVPPNKDNLSAVLSFLAKIPEAQSGPIVTNFSTLTQSDKEKIVNQVGQLYQSEGQAAINSYIKSQAAVLNANINAGIANFSEIANYIDTVQEVSAIPGEMPETINTLPTWADALITAGGQDLVYELV